MAIATYIGFLRFRNPWALSKVDSCSDEAIKRALFARINAGQITVPQGLNLRTSSADAFLDDLNSIEISWGKDGRLTAMLGLSLLFSDELLKSKWRLFYSPSGGYVTSDKPVSANEVETESGLLRYILTPLSSHWMLQVGQGADDETVFCEAGIDEVEEGNLAIACCADKKILGASEAQLRKLHDLRKADLE